MAMQNPWNADSLINVGQKVPPVLIRLILISKALLILSTLETIKNEKCCESMDEITN